MQRSMTQAQTRRMLSGALCAVLMLGAGPAAAQQQGTQQPAVPRASEPNGIFVVAKPAVVPAPKPVTAPAAPRTSLVDAEGKTYIPSFCRPPGR